MRSKRFLSGFLTLSLVLFGLQPLTQAQEITLPDDAGMMEQSAPKTGASPLPDAGSKKIRISPEAFRQLTPEQQNLIQQRMQSGGNRNSQNPSTETKQLSPAEGSGNIQNLDPQNIDPQKNDLLKQPFPKSGPEAPAEDLSDFERSMSGQPGDITAKLRQYGYDLFSGTPSTFAPVDDIPVPDDYAIAPGDEVIISTVSPRRSGDYSLTVNRNGTISYPNIGALPVAGMSFSKMTAFLTQKIKGGASDMRISVRLGKLRSIKIFAVGRVKKPGSYTISSLSTLSGALMACGGPTKMGTLRDIQLKRNGQVVSHFDYYDFLMKGDSVKDQRLQSGDVLFVPAIGPVIGVAGNVKQPGIFEMKGKVTLLDALKLAGNVAPTGYTQQIQIDRFTENNERVTIDVDLKKAKGQGNPLIGDGDIIKVFPITSKLVNTVYLEGNVERPGKYEYRPNFRVRDVIRNENDLKPESYLDFALIERVALPDFHHELIPFNLGKALAGDPNENKLLAQSDTIHVYYRWDVQEQPIVRIVGAVNSGGEFQLRPNMTLSELIYLAGGLKDEADLSNAELTRVQVINNKMATKRITVNLKSLLKGDKSSNLTLMKDDHLLVKQVPDFKLYRTVTLAGEVAQPGNYTFQDGDTLSDILARAGGITRRAYPKGVIFTRISVKQLQDARLQEFSKRLETDIYRKSAESIQGALSAETAKANQDALESKKGLLTSVKQTKAAGRMIVDLDQLLKYPHSQADIQLEEGDTLMVQPIINSISVLGQVYNPTAITFEAGKNVDYYLAKTGNPTENADTNGIYVIKADGSVLTDHNFQTGWGPWARGVRSANLDPGDTVMVPEKIAQDSSIRDVKDITQILFQIVSSAALTWGMIKK